jgi:hypothetical protein
MAYRVSPFQKEERKDEAPDTNARLSLLEEKLDKILTGGKFDGLL